MKKKSSYTLPQVYSSEVITLHRLFWYIFPEFSASFQKMIINHLLLGSDNNLTGA